MADSARLSELRAREQELIGSILIIEATVFVNQQALDRKTALLESATPAERTALNSEIAQLQATITQEKTRLGTLQSQLNVVTAEILDLEQELFPSPVPPPPPPPPPPSPALTALAKLPITTPIDAAKVLKTKLPSVSIPGLDKGQVAGLLSSTKAAVDKAKSAVTGALAMPAGLAAATSAAAAALGGAKAAAAAGLGSAAASALTNLAKTKLTEVTSAAGIGNLGLKPEQLEAQGLIKPGAIQMFLASKPVPAPTQEDTAEAERINKEGGQTTAAQVAVNRQLNTVLSSAAVWAGKDQINGLASLVKNTDLQSKIQQTSLKGSLDAIKKLGAVTGGETSAQLGALTQAAAKFGPAVTELWTKGLATPDLTSEINNLTKNAEQAVSLVNTQLKNLGALPFNPAGAVGTVKREVLNNAFARVLGDAKIPLPKFGGVAAAAASAFSSSTPDDQLVYTGTDVIVWDRINSERVQRGLPGLADIGYPRP